MFGFIYGPFLCQPQDNSVWLISNCDFLGNRAVQPSGSTYASPGSGGAVNIDGYVSLSVSGAIESTRFIDNAADKGGSLSISEVVWKGRLSFRNCSFANSTAADGGAILFSHVRTVAYFEDCTFDQCTAYDIEGAGGAVAANYSKLSMVRTNFSRNFAKSGGALWLGGPENSNLASNLVMSRCLLVENNATYYGGAVYVAHYSSLTAENSDFNNNGGLTFLSGGALAIVAYDDAAPCTLRQCRFRTNVASSGGAMLVTSRAELFGYVFVTLICILPP